MTPLQRAILDWLTPVQIDDPWDARSSGVVRFSDLRNAMRAQGLDVGLPLQRARLLREALDLLIEDGLVRRFQSGTVEGLDPVTLRPCLLPDWAYEITEQGVIALREESNED